MTVFNNDLYQAVSGASSPKIYLRKFDDTTNNWTAWQQTEGRTHGKVNLATSFDYGFGLGRMYMTLRDIDGYTYMRHTNDGTNWSSWTTDNGKTATDVSIHCSGSVCMQSVRGFSTSYIYTKQSTVLNGGWTLWNNDNKGAADPRSSVDLIEFKGYFYMSVYGRNTINTVYVDRMDPFKNTHEWVSAVKLK
jgi:hypothetical protein